MQLKTIDDNQFFIQRIAKQYWANGKESFAISFARIRWLHLLQSHTHSSNTYTETQSRVRDSIPFQNSFTSPINVTNTQLHRHLHSYYSICLFAYSMAGVFESNEYIRNIAAFFTRSRSLYTHSSCSCCCCLLLVTVAAAQRIDKNKTKQTKTHSHFISCS